MGVQVFELKRFGARVSLMLAAAGAAAIVDFASKEIVVATVPSSVFFNPFQDPGWASERVLFAAVVACSFLACVFPARLAAVGAGAAFGGAVGNLASRVQWWPEFGGTPDFIPMGENSIGNVADVFIFVGAWTMVFATVAWALLRALRRRYETR